MLEYEIHLMFIKDLKCLFKQWECGKCKRCFDHVGHLDDHVKTCNGGEIKHAWKAGVYNLPKNIKQRRAEYGFDVTKHSFLFPYLAVYDTEASLPTAEIQPAAKRIKTCNDIDGKTVERRLKFLTVHRLLSYSISTNMPGCDNEIFMCREGDSETDIKDLVKKFVNHQLVIIEKSFTTMKL